MTARLEQQGIGTLAYPFYTGLSTDATKPFPNDPTNNATFLELDTRRAFVWRDGAWVLFDAPPAVIDNSDLLRTLIDEVRRLRCGFEMYLSVPFVNTEDQ